MSDIEAIFEDLMTDRSEFVSLLDFEQPFVTSQQEEPVPQVSTNISPCIFNSWTVHQPLEIINIGPSFLSVKIKARDEEWDENNVPSSLYSSIRYHLTVSVDNTFLNPSHLLFKPMILDEDNNVISGPNNTSVLEGAPENVSLQSSKQQSMRAEATFSFKLRSTSYHHGRKRWKLVLSFFDYSISHSEPIFTTWSSLFTAYARKPALADRDDSQSKPIVKKSTKRKNEQEEMKNKKQKLNNDEPSSVTQFLICLDQLAEIKKSLSEQELSLVMTAVKQKLF